MYLISFCCLFILSFFEDDMVCVNLKMMCLCMRTFLREMGLFIFEGSLFHENDCMRGFCLIIFNSFNSILMITLGPSMEWHWNRSNFKIVFFNFLTSFTPQTPLDLAEVGEGNETVKLLQEYSKVCRSLGVMKISDSLLFAFVWILLLTFSSPTFLLLNFHWSIDSFFHSREMSKTLVMSSKICLFLLILCGVVLNLNS